VTSETRKPATSSGFIIFARSNPGRSSQIGVSVAPTSSVVARTSNGRASSARTRMKPSWPALAAV
jgi:hypothetical protein